MSDPTMSTTSVAHASPPRAATLDYRVAPPARPWSVLAVVSLASAVLACPGLPLLYYLKNWSWLGTFGSLLWTAVLAFMLLWGLVSGQLAWRETHSGDDSLRGRFLAEAGLVLNVTWLIIYLGAVGALNWFAHFGVG